MFQNDNANIPISSVMPGIIDTAILDIVELQPKAMGEEKIEFFTQLKQTQKMLTPACVATFLTWLLCEINSEEFSSKEWDIYDNTHHKNWLKTPHVVPDLGL
jgi:benzil reductase ((S)-benzoin forming)